MIPREDLAIPDGVKVIDVIIQTDETARQAFFLDTFLSHNIPLLLVGPTGKSFRAKDWIEDGGLCVRRYGQIGDQ